MFTYEMIGVFSAMVILGVVFCCLALVFHMKHHPEKYINWDELTSEYETDMLMALASHLPPYEKIIQYRREHGEGEFSVQELHDEALEFTYRAVHKFIAYYRNNFYSLSFSYPCENTKGWNISFYRDASDVYCWKINIKYIF